jgi:hypothetical protein
MREFFWAKQPTPPAAAAPPRPSSTQPSDPAQPKKKRTVSSDVLDATAKRAAQYLIDHGPATAYTIRLGTHSGPLAVSEALASTPNFIYDAATKMWRYEPSEEQHADRES